ncbi:unnamed protein product [Dicrocoelium dendriticum]|nr:unnamed protein product [Dicrocoelium dendriticum]
MLLRLLQFCLLVSYSMSERTKYTFQVAGYILENGKNVTWTDEMKDPKNTDVREIRENICERITRAVERLSNVPKYKVKCSQVEISGRPFRGRLELLFQLNNQLVDFDYLNKTHAILEKEIKRITLQNSKENGLVLGGMQTKWINFGAIYDLVAIYTVGVFDNGQLTEWVDSYNAPEKLKALEKSICLKIMAWVEKEPQVKNTNVKCNLFPPSPRHVFASYEATFNKAGKHIPSLVQAIEIFRATPATEPSRYDIDDGSAIFGGYSLTKKLCNYSVSMYTYSQQIIIFGVLAGLSTY